MKNTNEYINDVLKNYTTLKVYSEKNNLNYLKLWRLIKESDCRMLIIDERTKLYLIKDLERLTIQLKIKKGLKTNENIELRNYDPFK